MIESEPRNVFDYNNVYSIICYSSVNNYSKNNISINKRIVCAVNE